MNAQTVIETKIVLASQHVWHSTVILALGWRQKDEVQGFFVHTLEVWGGIKEALE